MPLIVLSPVRNRTASMWDATKFLVKSKPNEVYDISVELNDGKMFATQFLSADTFTNIYNIENTTLPWPAKIKSNRSLYKRLNIAFFYDAETNAIATIPTYDPNERMGDFYLSTNGGLTWEHAALQAKRWSKVCIGKDPDGNRVILIHSRNVGTTAISQALWGRSVGQSLQFTFDSSNGNISYTDILYMSTASMFIRHRALSSTAYQYSTDGGLTWINASIPITTTGINRMHVYQNKLIAITQDNKITFSEDGLTWSDAVNLPAEGSFSKMVYGKGEYIVYPSARSTLIARSTDLINWTLENIPGNFNEIAFAQNKWHFFLTSQSSTYLIYEP